MQAELDRVTHHLARAEALAASRPPASSSRLQRLLRRLLLDELARYRAAGRFPQNRELAVLTPCFVDAAGTRCAVAHLLELGGEGALVARIARERNHAFVRELADEPRLLAWLAAAGLTVDEAAAIQPSYCAQAASDCICGGDFAFVDYPVPARSVLEATVVAGGMARVDRVYGEALVAVGTTVSLQQSYPAGTLVMAPIDGPVTAPLASIAFEDGAYQCSAQGVSNAPPIDPGDFAAAVLSASCSTTLSTIDAAWSRRPPGCDDSGPGGCAVADDADPLAVGILLALVTALVRRAPARSPAAR